MNIKSLYNLIRLAIIPSKKNRFKPLLLRMEAFYVYTLLTIFTLFLISPVCDLRIGCWLSSLTQELIIEEVNPDREFMGLLPLEQNDKLTKAAQLKAEDMIAREYFSHTSPDGQKPWVWFDAVGYRYATAGENLAMDFSDPTVLEKAWLASPSHARNILNGYFTDIGIGVAEGQMNGKNTTVVVMFLGREVTPTLEKVLTGEVAQEPMEKKSEDLVPTPEADFATTQPEKPVITKTVEEESLDKEDSLILGSTEEPTSVASRPITTDLKLFLFGEGAQIIRTSLTLVFTFLLGSLILFTVQEKVSDYFTASRTFALGTLLALLWFPGVSSFIFLSLLSLFAL